MKIVNRQHLEDDVSLLTFERNGNQVTKRIRLRAGEDPRITDVLFFVIRKKVLEADRDLALLEHPNLEFPQLRAFCEVPWKREMFGAWLSRPEIERWFPELRGVAFPASFASATP